MKINIKKSLIVLLLFVLVVATLVTVSEAAYDWNAKINSLESKAAGDNSAVATSAQNIVGTIINVTRIIGTGVAIIMLTVVAIKYLSAAPGDKADIKKHAVVYVVGAVVLFASTNILGIIAKFAASIK